MALLSDDIAEFRNQLRAVSTWEDLQAAIQQTQTLQLKAKALEIAFGLALEAVELRDVELTAMKAAAYDHLRD